MRIPFIAAALLTASMAFAAGPEHHRPLPPAMDKIAILLDLDATQKLQVQEILQEQREKKRAQIKALRSEGKRLTREERLEQRKAMHQETVTRLKVVLGTEQVKKYEALADLMGPGKFHGRRHGPKTQEQSQEKPAK